MRKKIIFLVLVIGLALMLAAPRKGAPSPITTNPPPTVSATETTSTPLEPMISAPTGGFVVIVGANPRLNDKQQFAPPTNSVVVTNNEHLRMLIEEHEKSRK